MPIYIWKVLAHRDNDGLYFRCTRLIRSKYIEDSFGFDGNVQLHIEPIEDEI